MYANLSIQVIQVFIKK